jgi:hypothetical protein
MAERQVLRFRTWRPSRSGSTLRVDEALDLVGASLQRDTWGYDQNFSILPLFWRNDRTEIFSLEESGKSFRKITVSEGVPSLSELTNQYELVYKALRRALRSGVRARYVPSISRSRRLGPDTLIRQYVSIFGAGTVRAEDGERCPVWINKRQLTDWLDEETAPTLQHYPEQALELLEQVILSLKRAKFIVSINRPVIREVFRAWTKSNLSDADLERFYEGLHSSLKHGGAQRNPADHDRMLKRFIAELNDSAAGSRLQKRSR